MTRRQVHPDHGEQLTHPTAYLDQPQPERVQLHPSGARRDELPAQGVQQPVGRRVQQQPELWLAQKRLQPRRSAFIRARLKSFIQPSVSPRPTYQSWRSLGASPGGRLVTTKRLFVPSSIASALYTTRRSRPQLPAS